MIKWLILFFLTPNFLYAHTFTGMIGFYDGLSHPVLGFDHFLAMISVGIISAQIGGRAIWTVPLTFVLIMIIGGSIGIYIELNEMLQTKALDEINNSFNFSIVLNQTIEIGILISVIVLGLIISIEKKLPITLIMIFVGIFGFFHGSAHGLEMPWAVNPLLFALGFTTGTATLHLFGVIIGHLFIKSYISSIILKFLGLIFSLVGLFYFIQLF